MSAAMHEPVAPWTDTDAPFSEDVLDRLDAAFATAADDGVTDLPALAAAEPGVAGVPAAAHLVPAEARAWTISDDGAAEWALARVAQIDADLARDTERRDEWQARIDWWFAQASTVALRRRAFFQAHLVAYGAARRAADPKAPKTLNLPSGRITSTDHKAKVSVADDVALAEWLTGHGLAVTADGTELVKTTVKVYAVPLRTVLQPAGEGVVVVPTGEVLTGDDLPYGLEVVAEHTDYDIRPVAS